MKTVPTIFSLNLETRAKDLHSHVTLLVVSQLIILYCLLKVFNSNLLLMIYLQITYGEQRIQEAVGASVVV